MVVLAKQLEFVKAMNGLVYMKNLLRDVMKYLTFGHSVGDTTGYERLATPFHVSRCYLPTKEHPLSNF